MARKAVSTGTRGAPERMTATQTNAVFSSVSARLGGESYRPSQPRTLDETGLTESLVESLICKHLAAVGTGSGRSIAEQVCLSFGILEDRLQRLRSRQLLIHRASAPLNDYVYALTDQGG